MKVLVPYSERIVETIRKVVGNEATVIGSDRTVESMLEAGADADIVASGRVPNEYIRGAKSLKMIQAFGAGIDKIDREAVLERGDIIVCNDHTNAEEVAEYAIMLLLATAKRILHSDSNIRQGDWKYAWGGPLPNIQIRGKTCLIIGLGNIGLEIAKRMKGFNVQLYAATRSGEVKFPGIVDRVICVEDIPEVLPEVDFVILSLPLTEKSQNLVDSKFLKAMKSTSLLINISRGQIVDEEALFHALKENEIGGAGIDVWWDYPAQWGGSGKMPSEKYPFHELDNVVLSPHRAAYSAEIMRGQMIFVGENILRFIRGEKIENQVDMNLGY
ncbi:MAG: 2-hydroxyacid dehydrogenase [Candidatus Thorarchaeota archaeon]